MVAIKSHEADRFMARDVAGFSAYLVFGTDLGLVSERVRRIGKLLVDDPNDPFQMVRLSGDDVASDPGRLADEANTIPLFGGKRAILVDAGAKALVPALEHHLGSGSPCPVLVEAGNLKKDAPLRKLFERGRTAVAIECYPDEERDVLRLIDAEAAEAGMTIEPAAKQMLAALLGADRLASRSEIAKLTLYAHGRPAITLDDVEAVVADASAIATDALIDATFTGNLPAIEQAARRVLGHGGEAGVLLGFALRHATWLHRAKLDLIGGASLDQVMGTAARVGISFKRKSAIERQLKLGSGEALGRAVMRLGEAVGKARREPGLAQSLALRTLWAIALSMQGRPGAG
ncbi:MULTISPECIES: DNA polymerase III subunit delta [Lichenihabitans]|uniref:DNA polymerase III subunit delta n=1 Tax=Lichenihabitans TaxID=2723776 RepID=UPI0010356018|nr:MULTISPECIES: DNA polymerase III subunit delta [Lichenihabitans]UDL96395.1 DNA polymerase III subunit delta [Lichenihabitans sp. PAMC28606]